MFNLSKMIEEKVVKACPHTRKAQGIVLMPPSLIAQLAAAVMDKDEWAIVCTGERRDNGYVVEVRDYFIPPQDRSGSHVSTGEFDNGIDIVLHIHSHNKLGAFYSETDKQTTNTRFPACIVIAQAKNSYFGFDYLGTGKVTLPCGAVGEIPFKIQATVGPVVNEVSQVVHEEDNLGDCTRFDNKATDEFHVHYQAACGLSELEQLRANAFGAADTTLFDLVKMLPRGLQQIDYYGGIVNGVNIMNDPDLAWCVQHQKSDFCVYNSSKQMGKQLGGDTQKRLGKDLKKSSPKVGGGVGALVECLHESSQYGWCLDCQADLWGGSTDGRDAALTWCDDCYAYAKFENWVCELCNAPFCMSCGQGHTATDCEAGEDSDSTMLTGWGVA